MSDFRLVPRDYDSLASLVRDIVPAFEASDQARSLDDDDWGMGTVLLDAVGRYWMALMTRPDDSTVELVACRKLMEQLAVSRDPEVCNALELEIVRPLVAVAGREQLRRHGGPRFLDFAGIGDR